MRCNSAEHPILVTEPPWNTVANRERMAEIMFEEFQAPAFYIANTGVLNAYVIDGRSFWHDLAHLFFLSKICCWEGFRPGDRRWADDGKRDSCCRWICSPKRCIPKRKYEFLIQYSRVVVSHPRHGLFVVAQARPSARQTCPCHA